MQRIFIEIDLKHLNQNKSTNMSRANYYYANKQKKEIQQEIIYQANNQNIKKIETPCKVLAIWHVKNENRDLDNLLLKNVFDALQENNMLENDNLKHIKKITHDYIVDKQKQGVEILFTKVGEYFNEKEQKSESV